MTRSDEPCSQRLDGIHILLVDDQQDSRDMLRYALEGYGALVTVAASAEHAVTLFWQVRPNVLVTDLSMPGGDGYELLRILRTIEHPGGDRTPAILVTGLPPHEHRERARLAGFAALLPKPLDIKALCAAIVRLVRDGEFQ